MNSLRRVAERPARTRHARASVRSAAAVVVTAALLASGSLSAAANDDIVDALRVTEGEAVPVEDALSALIGPERAEVLHERAEEKATAFAASARTTERISGSNRYETAVEISKFHEPGVSVVYVAAGSGFADALSAAPAAAYEGGSLLLVERNRIPDVVKSELARLDPSRIVVVGGTGAISASVATQLGAYAPVTRVAGSNRYETSRKVTEGAFPRNTEFAFLATGANFPDALAAGAAAGTWEIPVILVNGSSSTTDAATRQVLNRLGIDDVFIAGGTGAVSRGIENDLYNRGWGVARFSGSDRYETATVINEVVWIWATGAFLATGAGFADALAGAALAGQIPAPLYVVRPSCIPQHTLDHADYLGVELFVLLGGTSALGSGVERQTPCR